MELEPGRGDMCGMEYDDCNDNVVNEVEKGCASSTGRHIVLRFHSF
jgi:hypothetical protein